MFKMLTVLLSTTDNIEKYNKKNIEYFPYINHNTIL
jgi:hypothetical protein